VLAQNTALRSTSGTGDTLAGIAKRFVGDERCRGRSRSYNRISRVEPGQLVAVPLRPLNPLGQSRPTRYQTDPGSSAITASAHGGADDRDARSFAAQLDYLGKNGYTVVRLSAQVPISCGARRDFRRRPSSYLRSTGTRLRLSVRVSASQEALVPATVFLYHPHVIGGTAISLGWPQIRGDGAIWASSDFQSHSKTHSNLTIPAREQNGPAIPAAPRQRDSRARDLIPDLQNTVTNYTFPYGDANELVLERLAQADQQSGSDRESARHAFFAHPLICAGPWCRRVRPRAGPAHPAVFRPWTCDESRSAAACLAATLSLTARRVS